MEKNCKICGSKKIKTLFSSFNIHGRNILDNKVNFDIFQCDDCRVVFVGDILVNELFFSQYYDSNYYSDKGKQGGFLSFLIKKSEEFSFKRKKSLILKYFKNRKEKIEILDIGCGEGKFLESLSSHRFIKLGVEMSKKGYLASRKKDLAVLNNDFLKIDFKNRKFDVICLWHVLEHFQDPGKVLNKINTLLKKKGILILSTPNTKSCGFKIGGILWFHLDSPRHLFLFNEKCLRLLLRKKGFRLLKTVNEFYDYFLDLFWSLRKSNFRFLFYPFYPAIKIFCRETITLICQKNH